MRRLGPAAAAVGLVAVLAGGEAVAQRPLDEAIIPLSNYRAPDARALGETHWVELKGLYDDVRRCAPEVDFNKPGIGFRRPQDVPGALPHLALWVWVETPERGSDVGGRAAEAFRLYGRKLIARLVGRATIHTDSRAGGYIVVMTWVGPAEVAGRMVGETLVVRADKSAAAAFVNGSLPALDFLNRVALRLFDGETELSRSTLSLQEQEVVVPTPPC